MPSRKKLQKFAANQSAVNVVEDGNETWTTIIGNWNKLMFKNSNPIVLECGCGYGEYSIGLSQVFTDKNFVGIDIKGGRIFKGSQEALSKGLNNVAFLRTQILYLEEFFEKGEVDEIWVTFPDPRSKDRDERKRLISPRFLKIYNKVLKEGGIVHLKTDSTFLYEYSVELLNSLGIEMIENESDLYQNQRLLEEHHGLQTRYEKLFMGKGETIKYIRFKLHKEKLESIEKW